MNKCSIYPVANACNHMMIFIILNIYEIEMKKYKDIKKEREEHTGREGEREGDGRGRESGDGEGEWVYYVVSSNGGITSYGWL